jgi:hypothetical protein
MLYTAIQYARQLAHEADPANAPSLYWFRLEFNGLTNHRLMYDLPNRTSWPEISAEKIGWPKLTEALAESQVAFAGNFQSIINDEQIADLLDELAHRLAMLFGVDELVRSVRPGRVVVASYRPK